jgi:hypothetical protein
MSTFQLQLRHKVRSALEKVFQIEYVYASAANKLPMPSLPFLKPAFKYLKTPAKKIRGWRVPRKEGATSK